jgi:hypothetical protein
MRWTARGRSLLRVPASGDAVASSAGRCGPGRAQPSHGRPGTAGRPAVTWPHMSAGGPLRTAGLPAGATRASMLQADFAVILTVAPEASGTTRRSSLAMARFGAATAGWVCGLAGAIHRTIQPLVARARGLAGLPALPPPGCKAGRHPLATGSLAGCSPNAMDPQRGKRSQIPSGRLCRCVTALPPRAQTWMFCGSRSSLIADEMMSW